MARKRKDQEEVKVYNGGGVGYSQAALERVMRGTYGTDTGRKPQYHTSQEQLEQAKSLPVLEGLTRSNSFNNSNSSRQNHVNTERARRNYEQKIGHTPIGKALTEKDTDILYNGALRMLNNNMSASEAAEDMRSGSSNSTAGMMQNYIRNKDWQKEYGKSLEELIQDYANDDNAMERHTNKIAQSGGNLSKTLGSTYLNAFVKPLMGAKTSVTNLVNPDSSKSKNANKMARVYSNISKNAREDVTKNMSGAGKTIYNVTTNVVDQALPYLLPGGKAIGAVNTLFRTAEDKRESLEDRGITGRGAVGQALASGGIDAALDVVGLEKIKGLNALKKSQSIGKALAGASLIGGGEQGITSVLNEAIDRVANGKDSVFSTNKQNYINQGMSEEEADKQATIDEAMTIAQETGQGALFGGIMGLGGRAATSAAKKLPFLKGASPETNISDKANQLTDNLTLATKQANEGQFGVKHMDEITENDVKPILDARGKLTKVINENPQIKRRVDGDIKPAEVLDSEIDSLRNQMDNYARGGMKENALFDCGETPAVLKESGVKGNRIMARQNVYDKITMPEGFIKNKTKKLEKVHFHGLGSDGFEKIIKGLNDPIVTLNTKHNGKDSVVAIINYTSQDGTPVLAAVTLGKDGSISNISDIDSSAKLTTGHIRGNLDSYLEKRAQDIRYIKGDDNSASTGFGTTGLESSSPENNVPPIDGNVNKVMNESVSQVPRSVAKVPTETPVPEVDGKVRSFSERGSMDESLPDEVRNVLAGDYYSVARNADTEVRANELFNADDLTQTRSNLEQALDKRDPAAALLSYKLAGAYVDNGDYDAATDVIRQASAKLTEAGQFTQAAKLAMMKNDPMAAMRSYMRDLDDLNEWGRKKYGKKWNNIELSPEDIDAFNSIDVGDAESLSSLVSSLNGKFSKEIPATAWDKFVGATKIAMLLNPRTQGRNILANVAMLPIKSSADRVSALGQNVAHLINPDVKVTQSLTGGNKAQKKIAGEIFDSMKDSILGENKMKDSAKSDIVSRRQTFNDDWFAKWIDNLTNGGIQKLNQKLGAEANRSTMETLGNFTYWLMGDFGDTPFVKKNFVNRLASYMKAQGIENLDDVPDDAIALATQEALKATFKDDNAFSKAIQGVKQKTGKFGEVALPFTKTPANLTMRAIDYSPAGLVNTVRKIKSGADASAVIDELSKNLTGTALIYLGYKLRENGLLSGNYSDDADEKEFQKRQGMLENAFHIGNNYYTFDWSQPAATPLIIGSVIADATSKSDNDNMGIMDVVNATFKGGIDVANSLISSSPVQSLADMLGGNTYNSGGIAGRIAQEMIEMPERLVPSIMGATARVIDPIYRDAYNKDDSLTGILGNELKSAMTKVPFLSKTLPISYDTWGQERRRSNSAGEAAFAQFLNPGQLGNDTSLPIDKEIQSIYDATGDKQVFPIKAPRSLTLGSETKNLTNKEHSEYQKVLGQMSRDFAEGLVANEDFAQLSPDEKAAMLGKAYNFANQVSKEQLFDHVVDSNKTLKEAYENGGTDGVVNYLINKGKADELGLSYDTYVREESKKPGGATEYAEAKAKADALGMSVTTYLKQEEKAPGGAQAYAEAKQEAKDAGFENKNGQVNVEQYQKVLKQAGAQSDKLLNDIPALEGMGIPKSAYYTYANAINVIPSLTPSEFVSTYNEINTNTENAMTQKELLAYLNKYQFSDDPAEDERIANEYWSAYGGWTNKAGVPKKIKLVNGQWKSYY